MNEIYLAGGCFWGMQAFFDQVQGVMSTEVGYANGKIENPTYQEVCGHQSGFAEALKIRYDSSQVSLSFLLRLYFQVVDPISINRQGNDIGSQYRTGIYYVEEKDADIINYELNQLQNQYKEKLAIEHLPLVNYYSAEQYHQDYLKKNPQGYCHISKAKMDIAKKAQEKHYKKLDEAELKKKLTPEQFAVTQGSKTEAPFQNEYWNHEKAGLYVDITTGEPLFTSLDKFHSGCGWPSFAKPIRSDVIQEVRDQSHGMERIEVKSKNSESHLGHVFNDGPVDLGGLRYCINSASLRFIPKENLIDEGYAAYCILFENTKE